MYLAQIGLQPQDLESVGVDPGAPFERDRVNMAADAIAADAAFLIFPLPEINLPGEAAVCAAQAFTLHLKIGDQKWMKNENNGGQADTAMVVRKHFRAGATVAILLDV